MVMQFPHDHCRQLRISNISERVNGGDLKENRSGGTSPMMKLVCQLLQAGMNDCWQIVSWIITLKYLI
jgi:hypothetical protein